MRRNSRVSSFITAAVLGAAAVVAPSVGCSSTVEVGRAAEGVTDSQVVCQTCSPELLEAKREGILHAMTLLESYAGADVPPDIAPLTFHLDEDAMCGTAGQMLEKEGYLTGYFKLDAQGKGHCCLFDVESRNRALAFTPNNAATLQDQVLPIHEAVHAWFSGRADDARLEEPIAKMVSFVLSGTMPDPCTGFRTSAQPDNLIENLCDAGFTMADLPTLLRRTAAVSLQAGRALSNEEVAQIVSDVIGTDARAAFYAAGLL